MAALLLVSTSTLRFLSSGQHRSACQMAANSPENGLCSVRRPSVNEWRSGPGPCPQPGGSSITAPDPARPLQAELLTATCMTPSTVAPMPVAARIYNSTIRRLLILPQWSAIHKPLLSPFTVYACPQVSKIPLKKAELGGSV